MTTLKISKDIRGMLVAGLVIAVLATLFTSLRTTAFSGQSETVIEHADTVNITNEAGELELSQPLGGEATTSVSQISSFNTVDAHGCVRLADPELSFGNYTQDAVWKCIEVINFASATNTPVAWQNRKGEQIWVTDNTDIQLLGVPSSTARMIIGTSTTAFINNTETEHIATGVITGTNSILITGDFDSSNSATTTSVFFKEDYQGSDTRDGSGERHFVPVVPGDYVTVFATSTNPGAIFTSDSYFDGQLHLEYLLID